MHRSLLRSATLLLGFALTFLAGTTFAGRTADPIASAVVSRDAATAEPADWGTFYTYFAEETYGTTNALAGVAVIDPGEEIHPPHRHTGEEYLLVTSGEGTWHLNGESFPARTGDMLYASPWDVHGIRNTGTTPLTFVVWKWDNKGVPVPVDPNE